MSITRLGLMTSAMEPITIAPLAAYSDHVAAGIGRLMYELDPGFGDEPITREHLVRIIDSGYHEQIIAYDNRGDLPRIVGALTISTLLEPGMPPYGYLAGVVVSEHARSFGIGMRLLLAAESWASSRGMVSIELITEEPRKAAIALYERWGARRVTDGKGVKDGILYAKTLEHEDNMVGAL